MEVKNLADLKATIKSSDAAKQKLLSDPEKFIDEIEVRPPMWNRKIFLTVVLIVGAALLISMVIAAFIVLSPGEVVKDASGKPILLQKEVDNFFVMIASAAIGALAGLLAPSPEG